MLLDAEGRLMRRTIGFLPAYTLVPDGNETVDAVANAEVVIDVNKAEFICRAEKPTRRPTPAGGSTPDERRG